MTSHPNRNWRSRWSVSLDEQTATHRDGFVFKFTPVDGEQGVFDGVCIKTPPPPHTKELMQRAPRLAREAGEIWNEARRERH